MQAMLRLLLQVAVQSKAIKTFHLGKTILERPLITIYCLRSVNQDGVMTDWQLPEALLNSITAPV